ncbi:MAG: plasmid recombination protein [Hydrogenophaga sp.]|nr:plasmid recombination protein [Hydrogenophaga sp.]
MNAHDTTSPVLLFRVKTIGMSTRNGRKPCTLEQAARHNLREIQAEQGAHSHIDARRMADNRILVGHTTASEVVAMAQRLLEVVDTSKLKRDHVQAIECVFSLPAGSGIDEAAFFARCLEWLSKAVPLPVLSFVVHFDEAAPHAHALLLPVKAGKHIGGDLFDLASVKRLTTAFFDKVAGPAGLKRSAAKFYGQAKQWAIDAVLRECEARGLPTANGPLWGLWRAAIERDPTEAVGLLGIDVNSIRPREAAQHERPIALEGRPIALVKQGVNNQELSCVALAQPAPPNEATKAPQAMPTATAREDVAAAGEDLASVVPDTVDCAQTAPAPATAARQDVGQLAGVVTPTQAMAGCRKAERLNKGREAIQHGFDLHARKPTTKPLPVVPAERHVERDEHAHDLSAWD